MPRFNLDFPGISGLILASSALGFFGGIKAVEHVVVDNMPNSVDHVRLTESNEYKSISFSVPGSVVDGRFRPSDAWADSLAKALGNEYKLAEGTNLDMSHGSPQKLLVTKRLYFGFGMIRKDPSQGHE